MNFPGEWRVSSGQNPERRLRLCDIKPSRHLTAVYGQLLIVAEVLNRVSGALTLAVGLNPRLAIK